MFKIENFVADYHRNGVGGRGFYVCAFTFTEDGTAQEMMAVMFPSGNSSSPYYLPTFNAHEGRGEEIAVFDRNRIGMGQITFGCNAFRGDYFIGPLTSLLHIALREREAYNDAVGVAVRTWGDGCAARKYGAVSTSVVWDGGLR